MRSSTAAAGGECGTISNWRAAYAAAFDIAIDLHGGPRSAWLTWATRAPLRVGYDVPGRAWMYTRVVHRPRGLRGRHSVENQWELLAAVDPALAGPGSGPRIAWEMPADPSARAALDRQLAAPACRPDGRIVVLHVSAGNPFRRWPEASFAELAGTLARERGESVGRDHGGSIGPRSGVPRHDEARRHAGLAADRILDAEGWSLTELRAVMDRASLFVGGDSGPLHIASTSDVPIVGLVWTHVAGALGTLASPDARDRVGRCRRTALPPLRPARLRAW